MQHTIFGSTIFNLPPHSGLAGGYNSKSVLVFFQKSVLAIFAETPGKLEYFKKKSKFFWIFFEVIQFSEGFRKNGRFFFVKKTGTDFEL